MTRRSRGRHSYPSRPWAVGPVGLFLACGVLVACGAYITSRDDEGGASMRAALRNPGAQARPPSAEDRFFTTNDPVERACDLHATLLSRIWRGYYRDRSEDLTMVPQAPNYPGGFDLPSHSGPWGYLQRVPLVLYGPRRIVASPSRVTGPASITDVYPTIGELTGVSLARRDGEVLDEALRSDVRGAPKLVVTVVWDGVGRNVLERWPRAWPALRSLEREGTSYLDATVGSSPSITPATHSSLGTGAFPDRHGMTAIMYRDEGGRIQIAFNGRDPSSLELTTFGDEIDLALDNEPRVGLLGWRSWHMGMFSHGSQLRGADADELALIGDAEGDVSGNPDLYSTPSYLSELRSLTRHSAELDRADGEADGEWRGHPIIEAHDNPAWVRYQSDLLLAMLRGGGYGADDVTDLMFVNFKVTDIVGHEYNMDSVEMRDVLEAQDEALARLVAFLEREVGDYTLVLTADHGHVPSAARTQAWAVGNTEVRADIDAHFGAPPDRSLAIDSGSTGLFLDHEVMRRMGVTSEDIARYLNGYTIRDNWKGKELPEGYEGRGREPVFSAAIPRSLRRDIARCAFGAPRT